MDSQLLVRLYNVGLGDCIYLRIPDSDDEVHVLIDCGNKFAKIDRLKKCIEHLEEEMLPNAEGGKKRLDLLVVTHPHEDHHKGFEEKYFENINIKRIWLSPAYNPDGDQVKSFAALQTAALRGLESLAPLAVGELKAEIDDLIRLSKSEALKMLNVTLPEKNQIKPLYVTAETSPDKLHIFKDDRNQFKVLAPMADIDGYYLGSVGQPNTEDSQIPKGVAEGYAALFPDTKPEEIEFPMNISTQDFRQLTNRMFPNALAAAEIIGHAVNNLSVVLLLVWRGRRLLFPGDAEWKEAHEGKVQKGRSNGSWNVMWEERRADLSDSLDFFKIGHHGSENATPWKPPDENTGEEHPINQILDSLLPKPKMNQSPTAHAVASTLRTERWPSIPDPDLMVELGKRVANASSEYHEASSPKPIPPNTPQPQRTDLEEQVVGAPIPFIELKFLPKIPG